jgi:hypothetical protein
MSGTAGHLYETVPEQQSPVIFNNIHNSAARLRNSYCFRLRPSHAFLKERDPALHVQLKVPARTS